MLRMFTIFFISHA